MMMSSRFNNHNKRNRHSQQTHVNPSSIPIVGKNKARLQSSLISAPKPIDLPSLKKESTHSLLSSSGHTHVAGGEPLAGKLDTSPSSNNLSTRDSLDPNIDDRIRQGNSKQQPSTEKNPAETPFDASSNKNVSAVPRESAWTKRPQIPIPVKEKESIPEKKEAVFTSFDNTLSNDTTIPSLENFAFLSSVSTDWATMDDNDDIPLPLLMKQLGKMDFQKPSESIAESKQYQQKPSGSLNYSTVAGGQNRSETDQGKLQTSIDGTRDSANDKNASIPGRSIWGTPVSSERYDPEYHDSKEESRKSRLYDDTKSNNERQSYNSLAHSSSREKMSHESQSTFRRDGSDHFERYPHDKRRLIHPPLPPGWPGAKYPKQSGPPDNDREENMGGHSGSTSDHGHGRHELYKDRHRLSSRYDSTSSEANRHTGPQRHHYRDEQSHTDENGNFMDEEEKRVWNSENFPRQSQRHRPLWQPSGEQEQPVSNQERYRGGPRSRYDSKQLDHTQRRREYSNGESRIRNKRENFSISHTPTILARGRHDDLEEKENEKTQTLQESQDKDERRHGDPPTTRKDQHKEFARTETRSTHSGRNQHSAHPTSVTYSLIKKDDEHIVEEIDKVMSNIKQMIHLPKQTSEQKEENNDNDNFDGTAERIDKNIGSKSGETCRTDAESIAISKEVKQTDQKKIRGILYKNDTTSSDGALPKPPVSPILSTVSASQFGISLPASIDPALKLNFFPVEIEEEETQASSTVSHDMETAKTLSSNLKPATLPIPVDAWDIPSTSLVPQDTGSTHVKATELASRDGLLTPDWSSTWTSNNPPANTLMDPRNKQIRSLWNEEETSPSSMPASSAPPTSITHGNSKQPQRTTMADHGNAYMVPIPPMGIPQGIYVPIFSNIPSQNWPHYPHHPAMSYSPSRQLPTQAGGLISSHAFPIASMNTGFPVASGYTYRSNPPMSTARPFTPSVSGRYPQSAHRLHANTSQVGPSSSMMSTWNPVSAPIDTVSPSMQPGLFMLHNPHGIATHPHSTYPSSPQRYSPHPQRQQSLSRKDPLSHSPTHPSSPSSSLPSKTAELAPTPFSHSTMQSTIPSVTTAHLNVSQPSLDASPVDSSAIYSGLPLALSKSDPGKRVEFKADPGPPEIMISANKQEGNIGRPASNDDILISLSDRANSVAKIRETSVTETTTTTKFRFTLVKTATSVPTPGSNDQKDLIAPQTNHIKSLGADSANDKNAIKTDESEKDNKKRPDTKRKPLKIQLIKRTDQSEITSQLQKESRTPESASESLQSPASASSSALPKKPHPSSNTYRRNQKTYNNRRKYTNE